MDGDFDRLDEIISNLDSVKDNEIAFQSFISAGFVGYSSYVELLLGVVPSAKTNPVVQFHVVYEMLLKAMFTDMDKYLKRMREFPIQQFAASISDAHGGSEKVVTSFSHRENLRAREMFTTYFENYKKMCVLLRSASDLLMEDSTAVALQWTVKNGPFPDEGCRYSGLRPDPNDFLIRNAISHKTIRRLENGRIEVEDKVARIRKVLTPRYMDGRLAWLIHRVRIVNYAMSLASITSNGMMLMALRTENILSRKAPPKRKE
jgi:hypothetical protein